MGFLRHEFGSDAQWSPSPDLSRPLVTVDPMENRLAVRFEYRTPTSTRLAAAARSERRCTKPGCAVLATVSMSYDYGNRLVFVGQLVEERHPAWYDLCRTHLDNLVPPRGWTLRRQPLTAVGSADPHNWSTGAPSAPTDTSRSTG